MAISGLATAGRVLGEPELVERAARAADFLHDNLRTDGGLLHSWRGGQAKNAAYLSDYVFLVRGQLALHEATEEDRWLERAAELTDEQVERLGDPREAFSLPASSPTYSSAAARSSTERCHRATRWRLSIFSSWPG